MKANIPPNNESMEKPLEKFNFKLPCTANPSEVRDKYRASRKYKYTLDGKLLEFPSYGEFLKSPEFRLDYKRKMELMNETVWKPLYDGETELNLDKRVDSEIESLILQWSEEREKRKAQGINMDFKGTFIQGMKCIGAEKYDQAIKLLKNAIEMRPNYADTYLQLGIAYSRRNDTKKGDQQNMIKSFYKALEIDPNVDAILRKNHGFANNPVGMGVLAIIDLVKNKDKSILSLIED